MTLVRHQSAIGLLLVALLFGLGLPAHADPTELAAEPAFFGPICHYLDRGFDDHLPGRTDRYSITPHGPRTLADLRHIELGLDLPVSHCENQSHSVPCSDQDDPQAWCVRRVALSVLGFDLYDESKPGGCLLRPRGGAGGTRTLASSDLRNHPLWGLTEDELLSLVSGFDPVTGSFQIPAIRFSGGYLSRLVEGVVGEQMASYVKGCANKLYCGNRRGRGRAGQDSHGRARLRAPPDLCPLDQLSGDRSFDPLGRRFGRVGSRRAGDPDRRRAPRRPRPHPGERVDPKMYRG